MDRHSPHVENASSDLFRIFWESCLKLRLDTSPCTSRTLHEQVCQHLCTYNQVIQVSWFCSTVLAGKCIYFVRDPFPISNFESGSPDLLRWCYSPTRWAINPPGFEVSRKWGSSHWDFSFQSFYIQSIVGDFHSFPLCAPKNDIQTTEGNGEIEGNGFKKLPGSSTSNPIWQPAQEVCQFLLHSPLKDSKSF